MVRRSSPHFISHFVRRETHEYVGNICRRTSEAHVDPNCGVLVRSVADAGSVNVRNKKRDTNPCSDDASRSPVTQWMCTTAGELGRCAFVRHLLRLATGGCDERACGLASYLWHVPPGVIYQWSRRGTRWQTSCDKSPHVFLRAPLPRQSI
jgi:hypothetical protein